MNVHFNSEKKMIIFVVIISTKKLKINHEIFLLLVFKYRNFVVQNGRKQK